MEYKIDHNIIPKCYVNSKNNLSFEDSLVECARLLSEKNLVALIGVGEEAALTNFFSIKLRKEKIKTITFSDPSLITCFSNDFGFSELFLKLVQLTLSKDELLIVFSRRGTSDVMVNAIIEAHKKEISVITFSAINEINRIAQLGDINFLVSSSEEFITTIGFLVIMRDIIDKYHNLRTVKTPILKEITVDSKVITLDLSK